MPERGPLPTVPGQREPEGLDRARVTGLLAGNAGIVDEIRGWIRLAATPYRDLWRGDLEDLEQEILLALVAGLSAGRYRGEGTLRAYVRRVVHHHCIDHLRAARRRPTVELGELELPASEELAPERLARAATVRIALAVAARTPAGCRELWRLLIAGRTYREMASELGVEEGALRVRVLRCRRRALALRDELTSGHGNDQAATTTVEGEDGAP